MISFTGIVELERFTGTITAMRTMKYQRCLSGEEAAYRANTDLIDTLICAACAEEARRLGITVVKNRTSG